MKGLSIKGREVHISQLQFDDDTLLFLDYNLPLLSNLKNLLVGFEVMSGLKMNLSKSLLTGLNICNSEVSAVA